LPLVPLGATVLLLAVAAIVVYFLMQPDDPPYVVVGDVDDFAVGEPVRNEDHSFYIVKLETGEFLALFQRSTHLGCTVAWLDDLDFQGKTGWFRDPCSNSTFTLEGALVFGPASRGLDRFPTEVVNGEVRVDTSRLICGPGAPAGTVCTP
jgi:Rieske Fe-S protein